ncbi:hypothetical protein MJT46_000436 [Ovis ammon polii x Ovis aries]|nr:hypothetical protein MJT46_000436 [Ovis ammon polii x Ovis aries]
MEKENVGFISSFPQKREGLLSLGTSALLNFSKWSSALHLDMGQNLGVLRKDIMLIASPEEDVEGEIINCTKNQLMDAIDAVNSPVTKGYHYPHFTCSNAIDCVTWEAPCLASTSSTYTVSVNIFQRPHTAVQRAKLRLRYGTCGKTDYREFLGNSAPNEVTE